MRRVVILFLIVGALITLSPGSPEARESPYLDGVVPQISAAGFVHPGVFVGLPQLEEVRRRVAAGVEPQASAYRWLLDRRHHELINRSAEWGVYSDALNPSKRCDPMSRQGCVMDAGYKGPGGRQHTDASKRNMSFQVNSAYTNALLYYYSGGQAKYARNAVGMLNSYARTFKGFVSDGENSYVGDLFAGWMSQTLVRAAEIVRYTYTPGRGEEAFDVEAFEVMLRSAFVPRLNEGTANVNNWRASAADGLINIAVFLDDRELYDRAVENWRELTKSYIYLSGDGERPESLLGGTDAQLDCRWIDNRSNACKTNPKKLPGLTYQNGQSQEICRDMWHASAGVGGIVNTAETAFIQGDDLYGEQRTRIMSGLSYMAQLSQGIGSKGYPSDFCAGASSGGFYSVDNPFPENWDSADPLSVVVAYNHFVHRRGIPFTTIAIPGFASASAQTDPVERYIKDNRSGPQDSYGFVTAWQVLTHSGVGSGVAPDAEPYRAPEKPSSDDADNVGPAGTDAPATIGWGRDVLFVSLGTALGLLLSAFGLGVRRLVRARRTCGRSPSEEVDDMRGTRGQ